MPSHRYQARLALILIGFLCIVPASSLAFQKDLDPNSSCAKALKPNFDAPFLVFFYADWAKPAVEMKAHLEQVATRYSIEVHTADMSKKKHPCASAEQWKVLGVPTLYAIKDLNVVGKPLMGYRPSDDKKITQLIEQMY